jgi:hypothetical protein
VTCFRLDRYRLDMTRTNLALTLLLVPGIALMTACSDNVNHLGSGDPDGGDDPSGSGGAADGRGGAADGRGGAADGTGGAFEGAGGRGAGSGGLGAGGTSSSGGFDGAGGDGAGGFDGAGGDHHGSGGNAGAGGIGAGGIHHGSGGTAGAGGLGAGGIGAGGLGAGGIHHGSGGNAGAGGIDGSGGLSSAGGSGGGDGMHQLLCWNGSATAQYSMQCREASDCIVATHWMGCCRVAAVGLNAEERTRYASFESLCGAAPACGCCCDFYSTEDGEVVPANTPLEVDCVSGTCTTFVR